MPVSLQRFLTCEGRYDVTFIYHLRLLLHFEGGLEIDFPYFLWMSLNKMVRSVKSLSKTKKTNIYHQGLIKMLVLHEIRKQRIIWKILITQHLPIEKKPVEESQRAPKKNKEPQKKKGKKDKATPSSSRTVSQNEKASKQARPSSIVNKTFKIQESSEAIDQMLQIPRNDLAIPFSIESLNDLYQKLTFPQRAWIFEIFLPEDAQFPKKNPPYSSSIFTVKSN
jgi:hypothetical protein